jgi:hypothetical protein
VEFDSPYPLAHAAPYLDVSGRELVRRVQDETGVELGLGKLLARQRDDVPYPGHPAVPEIRPGALDTEWMPIVARRGCLVFTATAASGPVPPSWSRSGAEPPGATPAILQPCQRRTTCPLTAWVVGEQAGWQCAIHEL